MFEKILVPLDGSKLAEFALHHACKLQPRELILLRVPVPQPVQLDVLAGYSWLPSDDKIDLARAEAADYLRDVVNQMMTPCPVRTLVSSGDEASVIIDSAESENVDLIVMSTHGYSGLTRWILGSVTERVLRQAPCPVLAVRDDMALDNIIITVDGSQHAESAVVPGLEVARLLDGQVAFLYVTNERQHAEAYVNQLTERHLNGPVVVSGSVLSGKPADAILEHAENVAADLIVMATHGRTGLRRWVYGSVTEKVLRGAQSALMVVRVPSDVLM
ncbi:MAG: universal stress protein [Anaerolineae bacterium]|nr:universal stress protein [Anaerolineae bacterium]MCO5205886.1 universal stress protein [Anaerolineae bacterium]